MRPQLITLVLTSSNLVSASATQLNDSTGNKDPTLQICHESGSTVEGETLERRTWASRAPLGAAKAKRDKSSILRQNKQSQARDHGNGDSDSDSDEDGDEDGDERGNEGGAGEEDDRRPSDNPPHTTTPLTLSTSATLSSNVPSTTSTPISIYPPISTTTGALSSPSAGIDDGNGERNPPNQQASDDHDGDGGNGDGDSDHHISNIVSGVVGGFLLLSVLLFGWYWVAIRRKQRDPLSRQRVALAKDTDLESHVTVDLTNGSHSSHSGLRDAGSSSDELSSYTMPTVPVAADGTLGAPGMERITFGGAAHGLLMLPLSSAAHVEPYPSLQRAPMASSPATSHMSFMDAYATPHSAHSQAHSKPYPPTGSPQGSTPPVFPPLGAPMRPLLQIGAPPMHSSLVPGTMELDGRPPPPRYPDAVATSQGPGLSPTSPLPVSPLSMNSPRDGPQAPTPLLAGERQYHSHLQQYDGPRQSNYEGYEPSTLPEVVSPICQLGQTSASLPEYDESAEAARSGVNSHAFVNEHHPGDEKQALQQPIARY
ncbi:hypothetical protein ANO14919_095280 [Xylariales sp. No.14919]|nr:hypothetical protein ANO14919_095280 [Xylariales sp. No.14919]